MSSLKLRRQPKKAPPPPPAPPPPLDTAEGVRGFLRAVSQEISAEYREFARVHGRVVVFVRPYMIPEEMRKNHDGRDLPMDLIPYVFPAAVIPKKAGELAHKLVADMRGEGYCYWFPCRFPGNTALPELWANLAKGQVESEAPTLAGVTLVVWSPVLSPAVLSWRSILQSPLQWAPTEETTDAFPSS